MNLPDPRRQRTAIWGAGREGQACWAWLRQRAPQARLQLWDADPDALERPPFCHDPFLQRIHLPADAPLPAVDLVIKSPGISPYQARIEAARRQGMRFTSGSNLWRAARPEAEVIAVSGTKGKSTTTALLAHLLHACGLRVELAGNIGRPLLESVDKRADYWVVELSSYQLADLDWTAPTAILLNLQQEHLDWHGSLARYHRDKLRLFGPNQLRVCPPDFRPPPLENGRWLHYNRPPQVHLGRTHFMLDTVALFPLQALPLPGDHNRLNACAALSCLHGLGVDIHGLEPALRRFAGLPHRLQLVCTRGGIDWFDDSISTTPEASLAALQAMGDRPVTLILGGHDRGLDWQAFLRAIRDRSGLRLLLLPDSGHRLAASLRRLRQAVWFEPVADLEQAVETARRITPAGGACLLSPGSPSYGAFRDYEQRGRAFARLACDTQADCSSED